MILDTLIPFRNIFSKAFPLDNKSIAHIIDTISEITKKSNIPKSQHLKLVLQLETLLINFMEAMGKNTTARINLSSVFGRYYLNIAVDGKKHNPLNDTTGYGLPLDSLALIKDVQSAWSINPIYKYIDGTNTINIKLPYEQTSMTMKTFIAIIMAAATYGVLCIMPAEFSNVLAEDYFQPLITLMIGIIKMLATALIFTATVTSICGMGDMHTFAGLGKKLLLKIQGANFMGAFLGLLPAFIFGGIFSEESSNNASIIKPIYDVFLKSIPTNIISPFADNNGLQVLFMGIVVGCLLLSVQTEIPNFITILRQIDFVVKKLLRAACSKLHYLVYCSLVCLLVSDITGKIDLVFEMVILTILIIYSILGANVIFTAAKCQKNIIELLKEFMPTYITGTTTGASIPMIVPLSKALKQTFLIKGKLLDFALPMEMVMQKYDIAISTSLWTMVILQSLDMQISLTQLIVVGIMSALLSTASPPVPGGSFIPLALVFQELGIPSDAMGLAISVDPILRAIRTGPRGIVYGLHIIMMDHEDKH